MALRVELKPSERLLIGESIITNGNQRARFLIDGTAPILREKDIMTVKRAVTPAARIYLAIQLMYTSRDPRAHHDIYFSLIRELVQAAPSTWPYIEIINNHILTGELYKALKTARKLIAYEQELLSDAKSDARVRKGRKPNLRPA
jgi:flagellar protein FlbT